MTGNIKVFDPFSQSTSLQVPAQSNASIIRSSPGNFGGNYSSNISSHHGVSDIFGVAAGGSHLTGSLAGTGSLGISLATPANPFSTPLNSPFSVNHPSSSAPAANPFTPNVFGSTPNPNPFSGSAPPGNPFAFGNTNPNPAFNATITPAAGTFTSGISAGTSFNPGYTGGSGGTSFNPGPSVSSFNTGGFTTGGGSSFNSGVSSFNTGGFTTGGGSPFNAGVSGNSPFVAGSYMNPGNSGVIAQGGINSGFGQQSGGASFTAGGFGGNYGNSAAGNPTSNPFFNI